MIPTVLGVSGGSNAFVVMQEVGSGSAKIGICNIKFDAAGSLFGRYINRDATKGIF